MTPLPQPYGRKLVGAVGYGALALALVAAFVPGAGDAIAATVGVVFGTPLVVVAGGLVAGAYGLKRLYETGNAGTEPESLTARPPERAHYPASSVSGENVDESVEAVGAALPEASAKDWWSYRERNDVTTTLRTLATDVLASEHDVSRADAAEMLAVGSWTDDDRAAAFLGGDEAAVLPLRVQFVDWLSGRAYERRAEATVDAVARHAGLSSTAVGAEETDDEERRTAEGAALPVNEPQADTAEVDGATSVADPRIDRSTTRPEPAADEDGDPVAVPEGPYAVHDGGRHDAWNRGDER